MIISEYSEFYPHLIWIPIHHPEIYGHLKKRGEKKPSLEW